MLGVIISLQVREERKLIKRLLVASRTRVNIDLPKYLDMYEFTVVPPSLFAPDGTFYKIFDKADLAAELRKQQHYQLYAIKFPIA